MRKLFLCVMICGLFSACKTEADRRQFEMANLPAYELRLVVEALKEGTETHIVGADAVDATLRTCIKKQGKELRRISIYVLVPLLEKKGALEWKWGLAFSLSYEKDEKGQVSLIKHSNPYLH